MIRFEITGDTVADIRAEIDQLRAPTPTAPGDLVHLLKTMPLDSLKDLVVKRFAAEGFLVAFSEQTANSGLPSTAPTQAQQPKAPDPSNIDVDLDATKPPKRKTKPTVDKEAAVAALQNGADSGPEADRAFVFNALGKLWDGNDAKQKDAVKSFTDRMAKKLNVEKISLAPTGEFVMIRAEMEKEFKIAA